MKKTLCRAWCSLCLAVAAHAAGPGRVLDGFKDIRAWKATPSDGVELALTAAPGGGALRMGFDFHGMAGYAAMRRPMPLVLPANYELSFRVRGDCPVNNLEFKLVDPTGDNVWWVNKPRFRFPSEWTRVVMKKRHVSFAWGPLGGGEARTIAALEVAITAGAGGRGHVDIRDLAIRELPPEAPYDRTPAASASASDAGHPAALDAGGATTWRTASERGWFQLDFGITREFGGLVLGWDRDDFATDYQVQVSEDGRGWSTLRRVRGGAGGARALPLPEAEGRFLRIACDRTSRGKGWGLKSLAVQPLAFGATPNAFFEAVAKAAPRGDYPRGFRGEQPYWTIVGVDGGLESALLGEDGAIEAGRGGFTVEPFLWTGGRLLRWSDVTSTQSLEKNYLPMPTVTWKAGELTLRVTTFASGDPAAPVLRCRYRVENGSRSRWKGTLFLAVRPFQVNSPIQFMGIPGGVAAIRSLGCQGRTVSVDGRPVLASVTRPDGFGASPFDQGSVLEYLHQGRLPLASAVEDPNAGASGALRYDLELDPGQGADTFTDLQLPGQGGGLKGLAPFEADFARTRAAWEEKLNRVAFQVPDAALMDTLRSSLAHILISRHGPALQPGTRAYARSWIRDGALISSALLQLGHSAEVRDFIRWFAPRQFANGKVPCVVDDRGSDPVPENDSHGEFLYLVAEYCRFTGDRKVVEECWPQVQKACAYIETLLEQRRTAEYQAGDKRLFYGLMPESISHEGYSARPVHSYWDDFFTLKGLGDAAYLAGIMGREDLRKAWADRRDRFRKDFYASIQRTMAGHGIAYLPGCAELGDFDATSTTAALSPGGELANLPRAAVEQTFETYFAEFVKRREGRGTGDRYTPYEMRTIGSFFLLGWTTRGHELIDWFMRDRRPLGWNQWPEVVQRDLRQPVFLGDLPHAWVGSDFIRSVMILFAHEREEDQALVLGAGLPEAWVRNPGGVRVAGLKVASGAVSYAARAEGGAVTVEVSGQVAIPPGGIRVRWPLSGTFGSATVDGRPARETTGSEVVIRQLPALILMQR